MLIKITSVSRRKLEHFAELTFQLNDILKKSLEKCVNYIKISFIFFCRILKSIEKNIADILCIFLSFF